MSTINDFATFLQNSKQHFRIEVEGKPKKITEFLTQYNSSHGTSLAIGDDGITTLDKDVDKWGLEYRLYLNNINGIPSEINITKNKAYRNLYAYRISDNNLIKQLLEKPGFHIGNN